MNLQMYINEMSMFVVNNVYTFLNLCLSWHFHNSALLQIISRKRFFVIT